MGIREDVYYEGGPHIGDLIINGLLALTIICLPLTVGAITRALWLRYRITNRRISVTGAGRGAIARTLSTLKFAKWSRFPVALAFGEIWLSPSRMAVG